MKYPIDPTTFVENVNHLVQHDKSQNLLIQKMSDLLSEAMDREGDSDCEWYNETEGLLKDLHALKMYHESRRFNEDNLRMQTGDTSTKSMVGILNENSLPESEGEMSEDDLAKLFKEKRSTKKKEVVKPLSKMTLEEIEEWESKQDNSNDIYKIKARVANLARGPGVSLTPQGEMLCNTFTHVLKALYDFTETIEDKDLKINLIKVIRNQEGMPGVLISAAGAGVKNSKKDQDKV